MFYVWFLIAVVLGIIEISTTNLVSIWFVVSSLISMIVSKFTDNLYIQIVIFVVIVILLMPLSKKIYSKIKSNNTKTNIDRIIGMKGIVTEDITKDNIGEVKVDGKKWTAMAKEKIAKGKKVKILKIEGVKLLVEEEK